MLLEKMEGYLAVLVEVEDTEYPFQLLEFQRLAIGAEEIVQLGGPGDKTSIPGVQVVECLTYGVWLEYFHFLPQLVHDPDGVYFVLEVLPQ